MSLVVARGLGKTFPGGVVALAHVDFSAEPGQLIALIGHNGSGKTTLLRILAGLESYQGSLEAPPSAFLSQEKALDPEMTGRETLQLMAVLNRVPCTYPPSLEKLLDRLVGTYSGGQAQRLHLALALQTQPELMLLDEPTGGLDPEGRTQVWEELKANRACVILATHDLEQAQRYADRVVMLREGNLVGDGPPQPDLGSTYQELTGRALSPAEPKKKKKNR